MSSSINPYKILPQNYLNNLHFSLFGLFTFLLLNIPSLKLFSDLEQSVNIIVAILLGFAFLCRIQKQEQLRLTRIKVIISGLFFVSFLITLTPELFGFRDLGNQFTYELSGFFYGIVVVTIVLFGVERRDIRTYILFQIAWGLLISTLHIINILSYYNYNHVTTPIALSILALFAFLYKHEQNKIIGFFSIILIVYQLAILLTLGGRSPFIGIPLSVITFSILHPLYNSKVDLINTVISIIGLLFVGSILLIIMLRLELVNASYLLTERLVELITSPQSEPRVEKTILIIEGVVENPIGYGLGSFTEVMQISHPDNLYLHFYFNGGWIVGMLVTIILVTGIKSSISHTMSKNDPYSIGMLLIIFYLSTILSLSAMITDMYIIFSAIAFGMVIPTQNLPRNNIE